MKRSCHGNSFHGGGTKGSVNLVEKATFQDVEFHMYASSIQQTNNHIYV